MAVNWGNLKLEPEVVAHLRYPEGEGRGMSYYTFHGGVPPPLPASVANEGPQQQVDGASAATVKEETDPEAPPAGPGNDQE